MMRHLVADGGKDRQESWKAGLYTTTCVYFFVTTEMNNLFDVTLSNIL